MLVCLDASAATAAACELALLGRKGLALAQAVRLGLPVPAGFVLTSAACERILRSGGAGQQELRQWLTEGVAWLENKAVARLDGSPPLRLAVRISPARRTMGLADAVLDVGGERKSVRGGGDESSAGSFEDLFLAVKSAFESWNQPLARRARQVQGSAERGMAVIVQQMVGESARAISAKPHAAHRLPIHALTRDPRTGRLAICPRTLRKSRRASEVFARVAESLERLFADLVEFECLCADNANGEGDELLLLDARLADREPEANVRVTCALADAGVLSREQAIGRIRAGDVMHFLLPSFSPAARDKAELLTEGTGASAGVAVGKPAFTAEEAIARAKAGEDVILVRKETYPEDIDAVRMATGILTTTGGMTSHAAIVARGWGKCCVVGASEIRINAGRRRLHVRGRTFTHEDSLSIDGSRGQIIAGALPMLKHRLTGDLSKLLGWADERRTMQVLANGDTPDDAKRARAFGAEGIGLCRTEHMFFAADRIEAMRQMILASTSGTRGAALERLLPFQRRDFIEILRVMDGLPVTVRLLDPPLHEFLPHERSAQAALAKSLKISLKSVQMRVAQLRESNPMMGHRGCRLSVTYPEILQMQVRAIVEAAVERKRFGGDPQLRIMHPLVGAAEELRLLREATMEAIEDSKMRIGFTGSLDIPIGTMIEVPRAALLADELAHHADFISFGTNDLTQLTFGYSRDDSAAFLPHYLEKGLLTRDPFDSLDVSGVGALIAMAVTKARGVKSEISISICGEHGGDVDSIRFCQQVGMDAVSCSPFRVPVARLAAGQAVP